ncbi:unnamed protein product [Periconia digitata]|uniref:Regulator of volume decrease after cellular swelling-domain-containing protein n=1 Tax=Periconia digitata TaxID=1303443 RepID=A0A9W4U5T4_9PLEO|nr:unnamed protein product [Periconia digitata]
MALRHLQEVPKATDFTPLQEHQEQTPTTFFGSKPVLYAHQTDLTLTATASQLKEDAAFAAFSSSASDGEDALIGDVAIWVNSENLILSQGTPNPTAVAIPYPSIALHATLKHTPSTEALLLNISLNDASTVNSAEEISVLELRVLPPAYTTPEPQNGCIKDIFAAMNTCADLHPDPEDGEENGEDVFDETAPGATGWITAENMGDFMDADGNFTGTVIGGEEELGPGAGTVRQREEVAEEEGETNGVGHAEKYQRTSS